MRERQLTFVTAIVTLVLILMSPARDITSTLTLLLGTVTVGITTLVVLLPQVTEKLTPYQIRISALFRVLGATVALVGMIVGTIIAPFSGSIPFLYYFLLSFVVLGQLLLSAYLIRIEL